MSQGRWKTRRNHSREGNNMRRSHGIAQSVLIKLKSKGSAITLWQWIPAQDQEAVDQETVAIFAALGYRQVAKEIGQAGVICLLSQCSDVEYVPKLEQEPKSLEWWTDQWWARAEDIEQVDPVILAFALPEVRGEMETITTLQFLPPPQLGEYAIVMGEEVDATYNVTQLPEQGQVIWRKLGDALYALAAPGQWIRVTALHAQCSNPFDYQRMVEAETAMILQSSGEARAKHEIMLDEIHTARRHIEAIQQAELRADWSHQWEGIQRMAQELATAYWTYHQNQAKTTMRQKSLPPITSSQLTRFPSANHFRALTQSFGPGMQSELWNEETSTDWRLLTPNGSLLRVVGESDHENRALHHYLTSMIGPEGLKHLIILLDTYYAQTDGKDRKADATVSLRQLLVRMDRGDHADDIDEQRKLMHTILYLARTWVTSTAPVQNQPSTGGRRRLQGRDYSPLLVLEGLKSDERGGISIPSQVEFHLGKDFYEHLFGEHQHFFILPTAKLLGYHSKNEQQELCLAFYLSDLINLSGGHKDFHFTTLLIQSGLQTENGTQQQDHRLRAAMRVIEAIEHLEKDGLIVRSSHYDIDLTLAIELAQKRQKLDNLAKATNERIQDRYLFVQALSLAELRKRRRIALQRLLDGKSDKITLSAGPFLKEQAEKREKQRQKASERNERAQVARVVKTATKQILENRAKDERK